MKRLSRRNVLQMIGSLTLSAAIPLPQGSFAGIWNQMFGYSPREMSPITPNDEFYITSYRTPPFILAENWTLSIKGLVKTPITITYPQLLARPHVSEIVTLECVGNGVAGEAIGTAEWEGLSLKTVLDEAGVESTAYDVLLRAADGYSDSFTVERAMVGDVLIAHRMNGETLPSGHGYPARIIVPGIYGMKNVQWLTEIELVAHDYQGYYQQKGWSDEATVKTKSWINDPQDGNTLTIGKRITMKGFAFAGTRGIRNVEVSTDGGHTWNLATLKPTLSPYAWVFWNQEWEPTRPGTYRILVRATDGTGQLQTSITQDPFPDGAAGIQDVVLTVKE